ncbi:hypothetical protein JKY72_01905 [Candidatus Gracilibacteria bacterium]|nr:hypothetical protein [Candidatus Gracilibacteria bacterium]
MSNEKDKGGPVDHIDGTRIPDGVEIIATISAGGVGKSADLTRILATLPEPVCGDENCEEPEESAVDCPEDCELPEDFVGDLEERFRLVLGPNAHLLSEDKPHDSDGNFRGFGFVKGYEGDPREALKRFMENNPELNGLGDDVRDDVSGADLSVIVETPVLTDKFEFDATAAEFRQIPNRPATIRRGMKKHGFGTMKADQFRGILNFDELPQIRTKTMRKSDSTLGIYDKRPEDIEPEDDES